MPLAAKGVRGKGRQPLSPPQHTEAGERSAPKQDPQTLRRLNEAAPAAEVARVAVLGLAYDGKLRFSGENRAVWPRVFRYKLRILRICPRCVAKCVAW